MPEIARFFGIIIRMFAEPAAPHHRPHTETFLSDSSGSLKHGRRFTT